MKERLVWIDGEMMPQSEAKISVFDHGFLYGDGVFEGIRVYNGVVFKCGAHLDRIYRNAEALHMFRQGGGASDRLGRRGTGFPYTKDEMRKILEQCVEANDIKEGYIRLIFSRGKGTLGLNPFQCQRPAVVCIADTISLYPPELYEHGMKVIVAQRPRTPTECLDPRLKSLNYLNNILAKVEAMDATPEDAPITETVLEAIMLSVDGYVGECTGDNLFIIKGGELFTSPVPVGMLDGITRQFVIDRLVPDCDLKITEKKLKLEDVLGADEIFLTGSAAEIIAVTQVGQKTGSGSGPEAYTYTRISDGEGSVTAKLRQAFRKIVSSDDIPTD
ncbi:MAG: aminotransferase class IV [Phycisphaerales bacterium]